MFKRIFFISVLCINFENKMKKNLKLKLLCLLTFKNLKTFFRLKIVIALKDFEDVLYLKFKFHKFN